MSAPLRIGWAMVAGLVVVTLIPLAGVLLSSSSLVPAAEASTLDIPGDVLAALEAAANASGIPWALLAGIASVATDFARDAPDGRLRGDGGDDPGTSIFPVVAPPITGHGAGDGMFLLDPGRAGLADRQDVTTAAATLADRIGAQAAERPWPAGATGLPEASMSGAGVAAFWRSVVAALPLRINGPAAGAASSSPNTPPTSALPSSANPIAGFARDLLGALNDPVSPTVIAAIVAWAAGEGSCARYNPLDTTQPEAGVTPFNTLPGGGHVWNYPSWSEGVEATVETLRNGLYQGILTALAVGAGRAALETAVRASPWGTGTFGSTNYRGARCPGSGSQIAANPGAVAGAVLAADDTMTIPALIVAQAAAYQAISAAASSAVGGPPVGGAMTAAATADIPAAWLDVIESAATHFGVPWSLVAAVLKETCDFGRSKGPGCRGPGSLAEGGGQGYALLTAAEWRRGLGVDALIPREGPTAPAGGGYATDGNGDGQADPWSPADAAASCARLLADLGGDQPGREAAAAFAYLHGAAAPVDPADQATAQIMAWFAGYGGDAAAPGTYTLPVDAAWYTRHPDWFQRPHHDYPAVDIPVPAGTRVYAVTSSTVIAADEGGGATSCGHDVRLRDSAGTVYTYCHGSAVLVRAGQRVVTGQLIMLSGWSGDVVPSGPAGAHLHFQINVPGAFSSSCPQSALAAWASDRAIDLHDLPSTGCVSGQAV